MRMGVIKLKEHEGRISLDIHQKVVKVMGDSAGQGAQGFKALRLLELDFQFTAFFFSRFAVGNIDDETP